MPPKELNCRPQPQHLVPQPQLSPPSLILGLLQTLPGTHPCPLAQVGNLDSRQVRVDGNAHGKMSGKHSSFHTTVQTLGGLGGRRHSHHPRLASRQALALEGHFQQGSTGRRRQCWGYPFAAGLLRNNKSFGGMSFTRLFKMRFLDVCGIQLFVWAPPTDNGELAFLGLTPWSLQLPVFSRTLELRNLTLSDPSALQMRKLRPRKGRHLVQGPLTVVGPAKTQKSGTADSQTAVFPTHSPGCGLAPPSPPKPLTPKQWCLEVG